MTMTSDQYVKIKELYKQYQKNFKKNYYGCITDRKSDENNLRGRELVPIEIERRNERYVTHNHL